MADKLINTRIRQKNDTEANWKSKDPVLLKGELAFSSDKNGRFKIGDGKSKWSTLAYATADSVPWSGVQNPPSTYTPSAHTHDDRYYTESEINSKLAGKSDTGHTHDDRYYTESEMNAKLAGKSDNGHSHNLSTMINTLAEGTSTPTDNDYYIAQYAGGGTSTTTYTRRLHSALWSYIKGKADSVYQAKGSYAASSHTHTIAQVSNLQTILDSKASASHTHTIAQVSGLQSALDGKAASVHSHSYAGSASAGGSANSAVKLDTTSAGSASQPVYFSGGKPVACSYTINASVPSGAKFTDTNTWRPLGTTGDTACAGNDSRLSNARPASDVYSWAKASSKPSYSWGEITGKPGTFNPSSHSHKDLDAIGTVGYYGSDVANSNGWYKVYSTTLTNYNDHVARLSIVSGYYPYASGLLILHLRCNNTTSLAVQQLIWETRQGFNADDVIINTNGNTWTLYLKITNSQYGRVKIRVLESMSTTSNWSMSLSNNSTKESTNPKATATAKDGATVNYANSAGSVAWGNVSGRPSSMPASDVYSWAKASSKPSYTKAEVGLGNVDNTADANKSVRYAASAGSATTATNATNANYLNIVANNEIRFNKPSWTTKNDLWIGYKWADSPGADLINAYHFGNGNGGYASIAAASVNVTNVNAAASVKIGQPNNSNNGAIELYGGSPYIDFHAGGTNTDYTSRMIAYSDRIEFVFA